MMKRIVMRRAAALGLALLFVVTALAGCARRSAVSLMIVSSYSGGGISGAVLTFAGGTGAESLSSDAAGVASGQVQADRTQLTVEAAGYQKAFLQVGELAQLPDTVKLTPLYLGTGIVLSDGEPVAGASVNVWNTTVTTGTDGSFTFEGLKEGTYTGRVTKQGFADATFNLVIGKGTKPVNVALQEGQLLPLTAVATLPAYELTASYHRTLKGEAGSFDGRVVKNGADVLVMTGDPAQPAASLMLRGGTGYALEGGTYTAKGETAAAAVRVLQNTCEGLLELPSTFSSRQFTAEKQAQTQLLGQPCDVWNIRGRYIFDGEAVTATATVTVGTRDTLAGVPVKIVLNARSQAFFDFVYDASIEIVSVDQAQTAARFPTQ